LQVDRIDVRGDEVSIGWSFLDPEVFPVPSSEGGRIRGTLVVRATNDASAEEQARAWWSQAQLLAAREFKLAIDADWIPGEPVRPRRWSVAGAWAALLDYLADGAADVQVLEGEIRVTHPEWRSVYRIDPHEWADYLNRFESAIPARNDYILPAAMPLVHGLPLWATDKLTEEEGAHGPVVALVDGRLVGLGDG